MAILRPLSPADLGAVFELNRAVEIADAIPLVTSLAEFEDWLSEPHFDLSADSRGAEVDGSLVGFARVWHRPSGQREERAYLLGAVHPHHRRQGIGSQLFEWQFDRARRRLEAGPAHLPRYVRAQAYDFETGARSLYQRHGLQPVRYQDELLRSLEGDLVPPKLGSTTITPWDDGRSEEARTVYNQAFADHWGSTPRDPATWRHFIGSTGIRTDLSHLAVDSGRVVGLALNAHYPDDEALSGRRDGWIFQLAVLGSHRRRGIGSALITSSLRSFRDAGFTHAALGVDSENPTGAYRLYEAMGFRRMTRSVVYQSPL